MSQALYRKWRPRLWDEVVAQEPVITTLKNAIRANRVGHAYLLAGPRGTGKTTTARLLAKALNCLDPDPANRPCDHCEHCEAINAGRFLDLIEIDAASNTSVDDVRALREKIHFAPSQGRYKVYIIDEVHMLSTAAFNALLKTLEEPPAHAIFILATTEVHKIPATVLSRVQRHEFRRIPVDEIRRHLKKLAEQENLQVDDETLTLIARQATGAMRDAISLLDQLSSTGGKVTLKEAQEVLGTAPSARITGLVDALLARDSGKGLEDIQAALDSGTDPRQFARQVVDYLRGVMLVKVGNADSVDATREQRDQMARHAQQFDTHALLEAIKAFNAAAVDARASWHPGLALELAFAEAVAPKAAPAAQQPESALPKTPAPQPAQTAQPPARAAQPQGAPPARSAAPPEPEYEDETPVLKQQSPAASGGPAQRPAQPASGRAPSGSPVPGQPAGRPASASSQPGAKTPTQSQAAPSQPAGGPPAGGPPAAGRQVTAQEVQQNWPRIKAHIKLRKAITAGLLNSCRASLKENTLILGFPSDVLKSKMDTAENLDLLRSSLQAILGAVINVKCVVIGGKNPQPDGVDSDGMVGTALDLGGKIIHEE